MDLAVIPGNLAVKPRNLAVKPSNLAVKPRNLAVQPSNLAVIPVKKVLGARGVDLAVDGIYVELPFLYKLQ